MKIRILSLFIVCATGFIFAQQQVNDPDFSTRVDHPAFSKSHPRVGIDERHNNFHTREGRYQPFAALMESDGFTVSPAPRFDAAALRNIDILVIANAMGESDNGTSMKSAFTNAECDAVENWVR